MAAGKTILITGVSRGLGRAMTEEFIRLGHTVIGCGRSEKAVADLKEQFPAPHDFSAVHLQARLASFIGPSVAAEEVFASPVVDLESASLSDLKFRRAFTIGATAKTLALAS